MKKIFLFCVGFSSLLAVSAWADPLPAQPAPVLRQVRVKGTISKNFVERTENSVSVRTEKVCDFDTTVPLYDLRGDQQKYVTFYPGADCSSQVNGQKVTELLSVYMTLSDDQGKGPEVKDAAAFLNSLKGDSDSSSGEMALPALAGNVGTKDRDNTSLLTHISPPIFSGIQHQPAHEELFSADVEFLDNAQ